MADLANIERVNGSGWLWPTIADATDTFLRRRGNNADGYERIWRLIHVWEALIITLAGASTARLRLMQAHDTNFRKCR